MTERLTDEAIDNIATGTIRTPRHEVVRYVAAMNCGGAFGPGCEYEGPTLTIEVADAADAQAMLDAISSRAAPADQIDGSRVAEAVENEGGNWVSCSGCHELNEGYPTGQYSPALKCYLGAGCRECGGIGAIWDTTDYAEIGDWLARQDAIDAAPADDLRALLKQAVDLIEGDAVGAEWKGRCRAFTTAARAALSQKGGDA